MDEPEVLDSALVPMSASPRPTATSSSDLEGSALSLFLVDSDRRLRAVQRVIDPDPAPEVAAALLSELSAGPTDVEQASGLSSALPPGLTLELADLSDGLALVDLVGEDPGPAAGQASLAAGQIVLTLTGLPGVTGVSLARNGRPIGVALPDGTLTEAPVGRAAYLGLLAP